MKVLCLLLGEEDCTFISTHLVFQLPVSRAEVSSMLEVIETPSSLQVCTDEAMHEALILGMTL